MKKVLFLDRDGIINVDHGYVYKIEDFEFVDGIFDVCRLALAKGYEIIVITNQAGIARGYYTHDDFHHLTEWMIKAFAKEQVAIADVFFCPHHPTSGVNDYKKVCQCRKPAPGMLLKAKEIHNIDLSKSIFIGDKISDMQAAEAAGIKKRVLVSGQYDDDQSVKATRVTTISAVKAYID